MVEYYCEKIYFVAIPIYPGVNTILPRSHWCGLTNWHKDAMQCPQGFRLHTIANRIYFLEAQHCTCKGDLRTLPNDDVISAIILQLGI